MECIMKHVFVPVAFCLLLMSVGYDSSAATAKLQTGGGRKLSSCVIEFLNGDRIICWEGSLSCSSQGRVTCVTSSYQIVSSNICGQEVELRLQCRSTGRYGGNCTEHNECSCSQVMRDPCNDMSCLSIISNTQHYGGATSTTCNCSSNFRDEVRP